MTLIRIKYYIEWMNSMLNEKDGGVTKRKPIVSITDDLKDGTSFADLISHLANISIPGIIYPINGCTLSEIDMISNVTKIVDFMNSMNITQHPDPKDIVRGDIKVTMKLIFSLACHYKQHHNRRKSCSNTTSAASSTASSHHVPELGHVTTPVTSSTSSLIKLNRCRLNMYDMARDAADSLSDARKDVSSPVHYHLSPRLSPYPNPNPNRLSADSGIPSIPLFDELDLESQASMDNSNIGGVIEESFMDIQSLSESLYQLQEMLLTDSNDDAAGGGAGAAGSGVDEDDDVDFSEEQLASLRDTRIKYTEQANDQLRRDIIDSRNLCRILQADKDSLTKRLNQEKEQYLKTKSESIRREFSRENLISLRVNLEKTIEEQDLKIANLKKELAIERQFNARKPNESDAQKLRSQITELQQRLLHVSDIEDQLEFKIKAHETRMNVMQDRILNSNGGQSTPHQPHITPNNKAMNTPFATPNNKNTNTPNLVSRFICEEDDDFRLAKKTLSTLRHTFHPPVSLSKDDQKKLVNDVTTRRQVAAIETLEYSISKLATKLNNSHQENQALNYSLSLIKSPNNKFNVSDAVSTKLVYYTDKSNTPYMTNINKRLGHITLLDVRLCLSNHNHHNHRYHFKAHDPEFGTVKEEIINDMDLVPGWEGKIIVWISTDHG